MLTKVSTTLSVPQRLEVKKDDEATTMPSYDVIFVFFLVTSTVFGSKVICKSVTVQKEKDMASDSNLEVTEAFLIRELEHCEHK